MKNWRICILIYCLSASLLNAQPARTTKQWMEVADKEANPQKAISYYLEVLKLEPTGITAAEAYNGCAIVRSGPAVNDFYKALEDSDKAIALDNRWAKYYAQRAYIYVQLSEYTLARRDFLVAIDKSPDQPGYYSGLSYCQTKHGRFDEAEITAQKGIDLDPKSPYAYRNRGRARLRKGMEDAAITDFETSLSLKHGQSFRIYCDLGEAYEQKGEFIQAMKYYKQSLEVNGKFAEALAAKRQLELKLKIGPPFVSTSISTFNGKRVALLLGNSTYLTAKKLSGQPVKDAAALKVRLAEMGFDTLSAINADNRKTHETLRLFYEKAKKADIALIFYAGHGIQHKGENFLLPIDVPIVDAPEFEFKAISVTNIIDALQKQDPKYCVFILDACRTDPFANSNVDKVSAFQGFKPIYIENTINNCYIAMATAPGSVAYNGPKQNGYFTSAILNYLKRGRRIDDVFRDVRKEVMTLTRRGGSAQQPESVVKTVDNLVW